MLVSLTDAVLALHFIPWGTDASEGSLQILTGTRRTRARKGYALIGIFKEKQEKHYSNMRSLFPSDIKASSAWALSVPPGHYGQMLP